MCGIVGYAGKLPSTVKGQDLMAFLLLLDSTRGVDGTGIYIAKVEKDVIKREVLIKTVGNCYNLLEGRQYAKHGFDGNIAIGHNRATSVGASTRANAHPHEFGNIVGVHNGTLTQFYDNNYPGRKNMNVDSEWIYHSINERGIEQTANKMTGSWSCVWWNKAENSLNFWRNDQRPMYIMAIASGAIIWASEKWMLNAVKDKYNLNGEVVPTVPNRLYIYALNGNDEIELISSDLLEGKKEPVYQSTSVSYPAKKHYPRHRVGKVLSSVPKTLPVEGGGLTCSCCGESGLLPIDIDYAYTGYEGRKYYVCRDCTAAYDYSHLY